MNVVIGADHNGVALKGAVREHLKSRDINVFDIGPDAADGSVDYVDYARQAGRIVAAGDAQFGILICGTGQGMSIAANKVHGVRAALVHNLQAAPLSREHNDANVLCMGAWVNPQDIALQIVDAWLGAAYGQFRHVRRVQKLECPGYQVVLANGVFDIVHSGHIELLNFAKSLGDKLVVAINSDSAVRLLKGPGRPINSDVDRRNVIQSLRSVDEVVVFDSTSTRDLVDAIKPSVIVKGGEWTAEQVRERDNVPWEVDIMIYPLKAGYSSTAVINNILGRSESCQMKT